MLVYLNVMIGLYFSIAAEWIEYGMLLYFGWVWMQDMECMFDDMSVLVEFVYMGVIKGVYID